MSTYISVADTIKEIEHWLRLSTFLHGPLKQSLLQILHNTANDPIYDGLPTDSHLLYQELQTIHLNKINTLKRRRILKQDQIDLIFPLNDNKTDSSKFDITLICILIRNCCNGLPPPLNGWDDKKPPAHDPSIAANVIRAREWRNYVHHTDPKDIDQLTFGNKWLESTQIINNLGYHYKASQLKTISLDPKHELVLKSLNSYVAKLTQDLNALGNKVTNVDNSVVKNSAAVSNIDRRVNINSAEVSNIDGRVNINSATVSNIDGRVNVNSAEVSNIDGRVDINAKEV